MRIQRISTTWNPGQTRDSNQPSAIHTSVQLGVETRLHYDSLIVAAGAGQSWFGNAHFAEFAPGMKTIDDALELRGRIFGAFELAELGASRGENVEHLLTFVAVVAGPTGVEMAGQIAELAHRTLRSDFTFIDTRDARNALVDAASQVLPQFGQRLGLKAHTQLTRIGVDVILGAVVTDVDEHGLDIRSADGATRRLDAACKIWAAGVEASPLAKTLAQQSGAPLDRAGRIHVNPYLTLPGHPEVFVIGDMMNLDGLPGVAQVAIQTARYAARSIDRRLKGQAPLAPFIYRDKGSMATISRFHAVATINRLPLSGLAAWILWLLLHVFYLVGFKNRMTAVLHWGVSFLGRGRAQRTSTEQQVHARAALSRLSQATNDSWQGRDEDASSCECGISTILLPEQSGDGVPPGVVAR